MRYLACQKRENAARLDIFHPRASMYKQNFQVRIIFNHLLLRHACRQFVAASAYPLRNIKATNKLHQTANYKTAAIQPQTSKQPQVSAIDWQYLDASESWSYAHISSENRHEFQSSLDSATSFFHVSYWAFDLSINDALLFSTVEYNQILQDLIIAAHLRVWLSVK